MSQEFGNQEKSYLSKILRSNLNTFKAFAYEKLTIGASVVSLTVPLETKYTEIRLESTIVSGAAIRYLLTGSSPTSTDGMALNNLEQISIQDMENIKNLKAIQTGAGTHVIHIQYFK